LLPNTRSLNIFQNFWGADSTPAHTPVKIGGGQTPLKRILFGVARARVATVVLLRLTLAIPKAMAVALSVASTVRGGREVDSMPAVSREKRWVNCVAGAAAAVASHN
jgi:hypothetical protein